MMHTKFHTRTNDELIRLVILSGCSQLEIELALRLVETMERIKQMEATRRCDECGTRLDGNT